MQTARRLYVYLLSGIGLGVLVAGVTMLLTVLFERLGLGPTGNLGFGGDETVRQQLTLASALTVVALPVWLLHWRAAERSVRPDRPNAPIERTSGVRGLYFFLAMGALLFATATALGGLIEAIIFRLVGAEDFDYRGIGSNLALFLTAGAAMAYHVRLRTRDWAAGPMTGDGAWVPRLYLYLATFAGLMLLLSAVRGAIELLGRLLLDVPTDIGGPEQAAWWTYPLATAVSGLVIGGGIFLGHTAYANRLIADTGWRGASERPARLRLAYYVAVVATTVAVAIYLVADGIRNALAAAMGVGEVAGPERIGLIVLPLVSAVAYLVAWRWHARRLQGETAALGDRDRMETADRLEVYPAALIGLAFGAVGVAWLLGILIDTAFGSPALSGQDQLREQLAQFAPIALIGAGVWLWYWRGVSARWTVDPAGEAASTTRRGALLIVLAVSILAGVLSAGLILYRIFGSLFGVSQSSDVIGELSLPIAGLLVAVAVALYHAIELRRDQALRAGLEAAPAAPVAAPASVTLRLTGPTGADLGTVVAELRGRLPAGFGLEVAAEPAPVAAPSVPRPNASV